MKQNGFTFIELMIVIAILGILMAIAVPQYHYFMAASRRTEGFSFLQGINIAEITYYTDNDVYTTQILNVWIAGAVDKIPKYYQGGPGRAPFMLGSSDHQRGYVGFLSGNIDGDPTLDTLALVVGAPQALAPGYLDGLYVIVDDLLL